MAHLVRVRPVLAWISPNEGDGPAVNVPLEVVLDGTTTQVPLFQDRAGTMPLPQPITAGARGYTQEFWAQVETLTTELAWLSGGLRGGAIEYDKEAAAIAQQALESVPNGVDQLDEITVVLTHDGTPVTGPIILPRGLQGDQGDRGVEGPYGGTQVTDPQVASMLADDATATGGTLKAKVFEAGEPLFTVLRGLTPMANPAVTAGAVDIAPIVQAALAAAPAGSIVRIPEGTYVSRGRITPPRGVTLWGYGVKIIQDAPGMVFDLVGGFDATHSVSSLVEATATLENGNATPTLQVTVPSEIAETWIRGEIVQLFADDWIPGSRPGTGSTVTSAGAVTFATSGVITTANAHTLTVGDGVYLTSPSPSGGSTGVYDKQRYYVKTTPSATTFTVSETFDGPPITVTASGTATRVAKVTAESRVGQHLRVLSFTKGGGLTTIVLSGKLNDPMTRNIRIARFKRQSRHQVYGFDLDRSQAQLDAGNASAVLSLIATVGARVRDVSVERNGSMGIITAGTYETTIDGVSTGWAWDDAVAHFGYGVLDNASSYLTVRDCRFNGVRHGYSDDTDRIVAGLTSPAKYGRSFANKVIDSTTMNASSSGWDTHHCSLGVEFTNVTSINCWAGIGLRGRKHMVRNLTVRGGRHGLFVFTEPAGGDSWGHDIDSVYCEDVLAFGVHVSINEGTSGDNPGRTWGRRETRPFRATNVVVKGAAGRAVSVVNATVSLDVLSVEAAKALPDDNVNVLFHNSAVDGGSWTYDFTGNEAGASVNVMRVASGTLLDVASVRLKSALGSRFSRLVQTGGTERVRIASATLDEMPVTSMTGGMLAGSYVNFRALATGASSSFVSVLGSQVASPSSVLYTQLGRTTDDYLALVNPSSVDTLAAFPAGQRLGQRLTIVNIGAGSATIVHGAAGNTTLFSGNPVTLTRSQTLQLVWAGAAGGSWRQVVA